MGFDYDTTLEQIELVRGATNEFDLAAYLAGEMTPVFFGTALGNFGVREMLDRARSERDGRGDTAGQPGENPPKE